MRLRSPVKAQGTGAQTPSPFTKGSSKLNDVFLSLISWYEIAVCFCPIGLYTSECVLLTAIRRLPCQQLLYTTTLLPNHDFRTLPAQIPPSPQSNHRKLRCLQ
ncbi:hypothetical protein CEXT_71191 [Caerostris extrusa]|uniref:Uncharacterized protein n=1 Tax=Caerostris extrusa TaxID=172846 RepID=A0AAV4Y8K2_CAEEX|nr:hypothetical protein CEXT_71191 [Caerostris extrusa]